MILNSLYIVSNRQREVDGVGGAGAGGAEEGVEVEKLIVRLWECLGGFCGVEPFFGEDGSDEAGGAGNRGGEKAGAEGWTVDEEVEFVGGFAAIVLRIEGDGEDAHVDVSRGDGHALHRTATDDDAMEVNLSVGGEVVFVELTEDGVGAVLLPHSLPMEPDEVGFFHVGREPGYYREVAAMGLLRLSFRVGHRSGHGTLALPTVPGVIYLVAEFTALVIALFSCHNNQYLIIYQTQEWTFYCVGMGLRAPKEHGRYLRCTTRAPPCYHRVGIELV